MSRTLKEQFLPVTAPFRPLPDFLIIGAQKCGTSSLFSWLGRHGRIRLPRGKEIHFFDNNYGRGVNWYRQHFPVRWRRGVFTTGEASPYYLFHPLVPERVFKHCPGVRLIVLLRNPADRAYSHYMMQKSRQFDPAGSFEEAISLEEERLGREMEKMQKDPFYCSTNHQRLSYVSRGFYAQQITHWLTFFPKEQFLFLRSEDLFSNPHPELKKVHRFLDIPPEAPDDLQPENTNQYPPMNEATRTILNALYEEDNRKLTALLGTRYW